MRDIVRCIGADALPIRSGPVVNAGLDEHRGVRVIPRGASTVLCALQRFIEKRWPVSASLKIAAETPRWMTISPGMDRYGFEVVLHDGKRTF